jgi:transposase-like protein
LADSVEKVAPLLGLRQRTSYPKPFKAQVVQECQQPGASVASVALNYGINANVVRKWLPLYREQQPQNLPAFIPLEVEPKNQAESSVSWQEAANYDLAQHR